MKPSRRESLSCRRCPVSSICTPATNFGIQVIVITVKSNDKNLRFLISRERTSADHSHTREAGSLPICEVNSAEEFDSPFSKLPNGLPAAYGLLVRSLYLRR